MEVIGYMCAALIGVSLGLIGGGGSILTVPILVYLFKIDPITSTAYSLLVVGLTSAGGSIVHFRNGNVQWKTAVLFGVPSILFVFLTRTFILPSVPHVISVLQCHFKKADVLMTLFAAVMIAAALFMIKPKNKPEPKIHPSYLFIVLQGILVGLLTGVLGAGGGFLIIPALVFWAGLSMKQSVGTSLVIISVNSLIGFLGDLETGVTFNFDFIIAFTLIALAGVMLGGYLTKFISNERLKPAFGIFVLLMGIFILWKELMPAVSKFGVV